MDIFREHLAIEPTVTFIANFDIGRSTTLINLRRLSAAALVSATAFSFASAARADFILDLTPVGQSVKFDNGSFAANTIFTGTSGLETIDFKANVAVVTAGGAASINAASSGRPPVTTPINTLWITPQDDTAFNLFSFRGAVFTNVDQLIKVTITDQFDSVFQFNITDNGDFTRIGFEAKPGTGELIKTIRIDGLGAGFDYFKQLGFGYQADVTPAVPEASTWAMMLLGFFGVGVLAYRQKKQGHVGLT